MRCVWDLGAANAKQVAEHMDERYRRSDLSPSTVGILLARLVTKGYLRFCPGLVPRGGGRSPHIYSPLVSLEAVLPAQVQRFLDDYRLDAETVAEVLDSLSAERQAAQKTAPTRRKRALIRRG